MKLILVMVTSLDGRSTQKGGGTNIHYWTSEEDQKHFQNVVENSRLLIMGSTTYEAARKSMKHKVGRKRVVITRDPSQYEQEKIEGQLEFTNEVPLDLLKRLEKEGFDEGFLVGGAYTNTEFFKQNLINELWQSLEPKILGLGNGLVGEEIIDVDLKLLSFEKLNEKGTLLLKYQVTIE